MPGRGGGSGDMTAVMTAVATAEQQAAAAAAAASAADAKATAAGNAASSAAGTATAAKSATDAMAAAPYMRGTRGRKTLTANIAIGTTLQVVVPLDVALPTTDYTAVVSLEGSAGILGQLSAVIVSAAGAKTTTQVTVAVQNSSLVAVGLNVVVGVVALY